MKPDDSDLRERFAAHRAEEERRAPLFSAVWTAAEGRARLPRAGRAGLRLAAALGSAALVTLAILWLRAPRSPDPVRGPEWARPSITQWRAPTDFLLETPAREVLRAVPRFGSAGFLGDSTPPLHSTPSPTSDPSHRRRES